MGWEWFRLHPYAHQVVHIRPTCCAHSPKAFGKPFFYILRVLESILGISFRVKLERNIERERERESERERDRPKRGRLWWYLLLLRGLSCGREKQVKNEMHKQGETSGDA